MAENSAISWTRHTWNPWMGCTKVSPACDGCYAEALMDKRYHKVQWGNAPRVRTGAHTWNDPFRWQRQADKDGDRPFVFCASLADIFDNQVNPQWRADAFEVMRKTPRLVYLLLTKRPQNIVKLADAAGGLPSNAALGTTVEDIPPAFMPNWIITGGETDQGDHKARPTHPDWFRSLRDQARANGASFHHKQNGEWIPWRPITGNPHGRPIEHVMQDGSQYYPGNFGASLQSMIKVGKKNSGRDLDGITHDAFPTVTA